LEYFIEVTTEMSAFSISMEKAALRHFEAGEHLFNKSPRKDVAGYLYGISAECAIKEIMSRSGIRPLAKEKRKKDPFYSHFPELKALLRNRIQGRYSQSLLCLIDNQYMQEWDVAMRYAPAGDIDTRKVDRWRQQAILAIKVMNGCVG
jgi:hypothetical protein